MLEKLFSILWAIRYSEVDEIKIGDLRAFSISHDTYALIIPNTDFIAVRVIGNTFTIPISAFRPFLLGAVGAREVLSNGMAVGYKEGSTVLTYEPDKTGFLVTMTTPSNKVISIRTVQ